MFQIHDLNPSLDQAGNTSELKNHLDETHDYHHKKNGQFPVLFVSPEKEKRWLMRSNVPVVWKLQYCQHHEFSQIDLGGEY